ncbi:MAG: AbrB/MazE/SpoVT family DNA-binding domain-containing protein [Thermoanaerobaculia bacterium]
MRTRIQRWGNSLALRIPKPFAAEAGLDQQSEVDVSVVDGVLVIKPCPEPSLTLEELLAGVTDENLHREIETGPPVGREIW